MPDSVELNHRITIGWPAERAIHLFTPKGEELWVDDWAPRYVDPTSGKTAQGMVFITDHGDETTYWTCLEWQPEQGFVRYLRLNPGSRVSYVTVSLSPATQGGSDVAVSYRVIPLGPDDGRTPTAAGFAEHIGTWKTLVEGLSAEQVGALAEDEKKD